MKQFVDKDGGNWEIDLTIGNVMRVRSANPVLDLLDPSKDTSGQPLQVALQVDFPLFWELLWLLVEPQAKSRGIDAEQFGQLVAADCLLESQAAFFAEWRDFFRSFRRPDAALAVETQAKAQAAALKLVAAKVETVDQAKLLSRIDSLLETRISEQFGRVRDSLESIPGESAGGNSTG